MADDERPDARPDTPLETRSAQLTGVRFADRIIELIVIPYEVETVINEAGRTFREIISRGAFEGIHRRGARIKVNRDHDWYRPVGKSLTVSPNDETGLLARVKIAQTPLGDETLELAAEGVLDASAGLRPMPGGESWHERRTLRRFHKLWLDHIALTPDPAYADARVLAVRSTVEPVTPSTAERPERPATPLLDEVRAWRLAEKFGSLTIE